MYPLLLIIIDLPESGLNTGLTPVPCPFAFGRHLAITTDKVVIGGFLPPVAAHAVRFHAEKSVLISYPNQQKVGSGRSEDTGR
jgi:hypothetical protein